jgi:hypothetical protein
MSLTRFFAAAALAVLLCGFAKKPKLSVRFHVEAIGNAGGSFTMPAKFVNPPRDGFIESVPFVSERNIKAIFPVQHPDGQLGCAFQLDRSGAIGLQTTSTDRRGASIVAFISTKTGTHQVVDMVIDKPIRDGIIYIPRGLSPGEIDMLKQLYPVMQPSKVRATPGPSMKPLE